MFYSDYDPDRRRPSVTLLGNDYRPATLNFLGTDGPPSVAPSAASAASPKKKSFFRKGGGFWDILGSVGDAMTGNPVYANVLQQRRAAELEDRRRKEDYDYWVARQQWMLDHLGSLQGGSS
jgi:hypothetical protein